MLDLVHCTLPRIFVRTPPQKSCAVSKAAAGKMIICDFHNGFWRNRFPFTASLGAPTARAAGCVPGETGRLFQSLEFPCQRCTVRCFESRNESDVVKQTVLGIKSEQEGTDYARSAGVTKTTYNTIGTANLFYFDRSGAFS